MTSKCTAVVAHGPASGEIISAIIRLLAAAHIEIDVDETNSLTCQPDATRLIKLREIAEQIRRTSDE